jgi:hypothetical protein
LLLFAHFVEIDEAVVGVSRDRGDRLDDGFERALVHNHPLFLFAFQFDGFFADELIEVEHLGSIQLS